MSFTETLKRVFVTAILAGSAAVLTTMAQQWAVRTVQALTQPEQPPIA